MSQNTAKIRLKIGQLEVEYEGNDIFLKDDIFQMLEKISDFHGKHLPTTPSEPAQVDGENGHATPKKKNITMSVAAIATRLNAKSEPEMAMVAATHLALVQEKDTFTKHDIRDNMKKAKGRYKKGMGHNLTDSLRRLVDQERLHEVSDGCYTLSEEEQTNMVNLLAKSK